MLRTLGDSCGFRKVLVGLLTAIAVLAIALDSADARRRRHKRQRSYNPPYAAIVVDGNSGEVLHSAKADAKRQPASLTKIMTLYLLFERLEKGQLKLDSRLEVSKRASKQPPIKLGLKPGQTITVEDAILGLITRSANDVAVVVAEAIADNENDFAKLMTSKAHALGMADTVYKNASGLANRNHLTTARDQARLAQAIQDRFPKYYGYFSRQSFTFRGETLENSNDLLGSVRGVNGIKTGSSKSSGYNLVASMKRDDRRLVAVVFGGKSSSRRNELMRNLLEKYAKRASTKRTNPPIAEMPLTGRKERTAVAPAKLIRSTIVRRKAHRRNRTITASAAAAGRRSRGTKIRPVAVKTIKVKLSRVKTAAVVPPLSSMPAMSLRKRERTMQSATKRAPAPTSAAATKSASRSIRVASADPTSIPAMAVKGVSRSVRESDAVSRKRARWLIQVGTFAAERDAKDRLRSAKSKARHILGGANPFTEKVAKDNKTFYRARFAGFDKREARAACSYLKRKDFACIALKH